MKHEKMECWRKLYEVHTQCTDTDDLPCFRDGIQGRDAASDGSPLGHVAAGVYRRGRSAVTFRQRFTLTRIAAKIFRALMHEGQELFVWRTYATGQHSKVLRPPQLHFASPVMDFFFSTRMRTWGQGTSSPLLFDQFNSFRHTSSFIFKQRPLMGMDPSVYSGWHYPIW